ncbi:MAG TPA: DUF305 domain-containing protein [Rubrobacteraceae bacterium]|nr:DUF305 domain-containing protein [Rubrobacteraceae bacterium]
MRTKYLVLILAVLAMLVVTGVGAAYASGQMALSNSTMTTNGHGTMDGMGSMMNAEGMSGGMATGSFDEDQPFDLQFIDQMIVHHQMAIMSSEHMISDSERPELRQLAENIQRSQSEQIEQMQEWRNEWHPDDTEQAPGMSNDMMDDGMMEQMMGGSMQRMMGGDTANAMFLRMMIPHHQDAIDMSEEALERAEHPELKELAQTIIDEQSAEIELMQGYLDEIETEGS